jgi:hypothetical protein
MWFCAVQLIAHAGCYVSFFMPIHSGAAAPRVPTSAATVKLRSKHVSQYLSSQNAHKGAASGVRRQTFKKRRRLARFPTSLWRKHLMSAANLVIAHAQQRPLRFLLSASGSAGGAAGRCSPMISLPTQYLPRQRRVVIPRSFRCHSTT